MEGAWTRIMHSVQLTSSGRPHLQQGEVECQLVDAVDLDCEGAGWTLKTGLLTLTTHRLLWLDEKGKKAWAVPLGAVGQLYAVKKSIKSMFAAPRMRFQAWTQRDGKLATHGQRVAELVLTLVFRGQSGVPDGFVQRFAEVLQAKAWQVDVVALHSQQKRLEESPSGGHKGAGSSLEASVHKRPTVSTLNPAMAGVSGILRKEQEQWEEADKNLHDAFQDLNGLMSKAKEMVILAEKMRVRLLTGQASTVEEEGVGTNQEMQDWMLSVGITSPVTKESAGALYHQQLSRQVHIFSSTLSMYVGFWVSVLQMFPYWKAELKSSVMSQALCRCKLEERFHITLSF
jgi:ESCRT-II complex subunit VPS36